MDFFTLLSAFLSKRYPSGIKSDTLDAAAQLVEATTGTAEAPRAEELFRSTYREVTGKKLEDEYLWEELCKRQAALSQANTSAAVAHSTTRFIPAFLREYVAAIQAHPVALGQHPSVLLPEAWALLVDDPTAENLQHFNQRLENEAHISIELLDLQRLPQDMRARILNTVSGHMKFGFEEGAWRYRQSSLGKLGEALALQATDPKDFTEIGLLELEARRSIAQHSHLQTYAIDMAHLHALALAQFYENSVLHGHYHIAYVLLHSEVFNAEAITQALQALHGEELGEMTVEIRELNNLRIGIPVTQLILRSVKASEAVIANTIGMLDELRADLAAYQPEPPEAVIPGRHLSPRDQSIETGRRIVEHLLNEPDLVGTEEETGLFDRFAALDASPASNHRSSSYDRELGQELSEVRTEIEYQIRNAARKVSDELSEEITNYLSDTYGQRSIHDYLVDLMQHGEIQQLVEIFEQSSSYFNRIMHNIEGSDKIEVTVTTAAGEEIEIVVPGILADIFDGHTVEEIQAQYPLTDEVFAALTATPKSEARSEKLLSLVQAHYFGDDGELKPEFTGTTPAVVSTPPNLFARPATQEQLAQIGQRVVNFILSDQALQARLARWKELCETEATDEASPDFDPALYQEFSDILGEIDERIAALEREAQTAIQNETGTNITVPARTDGTSSSIYQYVAQLIEQGDLKTVVRLNQVSFDYLNLGNIVLENEPTESLSSPAGEGLVFAPEDTTDDTAKIIKDAANPANHDLAKDAPGKPKPEGEGYAATDDEPTLPKAIGGDKVELKLPPLPGREVNDDVQELMENGRLTHRGLLQLQNVLNKNSQQPLALPNAHGAVAVFGGAQASSEAAIAAQMLLQALRTSGIVLMFAR